MAEIDPSDRATELEEIARDDALAEQRFRAGLEGKTVEDSAEECAVCGTDIPQARREAYPGAQTCVHCQEELERATI